MKLKRSLGFAIWVMERKLHNLTVKNVEASIVAQTIKNVDDFSTK